MFSRAVRVFRVQRARFSGGALMDTSKMTYEEFDNLRPLPPWIKKFLRPHEFGWVVLFGWFIGIYWIGKIMPAPKAFTELEYDIHEDVPDFETEPENFFYYLQSGEEFMKKIVKTLTPPTAEEIEKKMNKGKLKKAPPAQP